MWQKRSFLLVFLMGLPFISPLLSGTGTPCTHDGYFYFYRVAAMRHSWAQGLHFSRWLPDLAFGYGTPYFIYREPLPLYLTLFPHLLGLSLPASTNLFNITCILLAGIFTFLWVRDIFNENAGIVSAVAYMSAPYLLIDSFIRGNQPESLALALFPLLLWSGRRFLLIPTPRHFLLSAFSLLTLALSHNISLLTFTPFLLLYLLFIGRLGGLDWVTVGKRLTLFLVFSLGMALFYLGPIFLELNDVSLGNTTITRNNDFHFNFTTLAEIFSPVMPANPALINPPLPFRLGWMPAFLAFLSLIFYKKQQTKEQQNHILMMGLFATIFLFFSLPASQPLWENLPLIKFVQFPWRFIGRAALPIAMMAGAPFALPWHWSTRQPKSHKSEKNQFAPPEQKTSLAPTKTEKKKMPAFNLPSLLAAFAIIFLTVETLPNLYPKTCLQETFPTIQSVIHFEHESGLVGIDPEGSLFPKTVQQHPDGSILEADYLAGKMPARFDTTALPANAQLLQADYQPNRAQIKLHTPQPFTARYLTFAFAGWQVEIDGLPISITPTQPEGLISFPVPAGEHEILVRWGSTPARTFFNIISLLAIAGTFLTASQFLRYHALRGNVPRPLGSLPDMPSVSRTPHRRPVKRGKQELNFPLLLTAAILLLGGKLISDNWQTPWKHATAPPVSHKQTITAAELQLSGFNISQTIIASGESFDIDLAWQTTEIPKFRYQSNIWLQDEDGILWSDKETQRPRLYEDAPDSRFWQPGQWAWDSREVTVYAGIPPGQYNIILTIFDFDTLQPITFFDADGLPLGPQTSIGKINVTSPSQPPTFHPQQPLQKSLPDFTLLGFDMDRDTAAPGDPLLLTLYWQNSRERNKNSQITLLLLNSQNEVQKQWRVSPVGSWYPPSNWLDGERLRGQHLLRLPAFLTTGTYTLTLDGNPLAQIKINAPQRIFKPPPMANKAGAIFSDKVELTGYSMTENSELLQLELIWQAVTEMETSYRIFVHALDVNDNIITQSDGEPATWSRPTTGWTIGEFISDRHQLPNENDAIKSLRVGIYDPAAGNRLKLPDGTDFITIQP